MKYFPDDLQAPLLGTITFFPEINDTVLIQSTLSNEVCSIFVALDNKTYNSSDSNVSDFQT